MDLTPYVGTLRGDLAVAAEAGGDEARELAPSSVDVRLRGRAVSATVDGGTRPRTAQKAQSVGQSFTGWVR